MRIILLYMMVTFSVHHTYYAQDAATADSSQIEKIPIGYLQNVNKKIDTYTHRITSRTEKTLEKLARWENKIQKLLQKADPATAEKLFGSGQPTFSSVLAEYKSGKLQIEKYRADYDSYRDELTTQIKYLESKKDLLNTREKKILTSGKNKIDLLNTDVENTEWISEFIKKRRKALITEGVKHLGKSKYLQKVDKESFYYLETLQNYKQLFSDKKKAEETAFRLLKKIPAFNKFMRENSMLASLFRVPDNYGSAQSLVGLQTRASVNAQIQNRIASGGPNALQEVKQNLQQAQSELSKLKDKLMQKAGGANTEMDMPDFKPNMQKTKTFAQRIKYGLNFQFERNSSWMPAAANIGLSVGYQLNDKSLLGLGMGYKLGMGSIEKIRFSHEGVGLRSFIDWKLKKQFYVTGGFELNHYSGFQRISQLKDAASWQRSGLLGISKKTTISNKFIKGGKIQLLYDFLYREHVPVSQPVLFRVGYEF